MVLLETLANGLLALISMHTPGRLAAVGREMGLAFGRGSTSSGSDTKSDLVFI